MEVLQEKNGRDIGRIAQDRSGEQAAVTLRDDNHVYNLDAGSVSGERHIVCRVPPSWDILEWPEPVLPV
jgi:hypothetical protein